MTDIADKLSAKDRLVTRPNEPLPTAQDPQQHGSPKDPKPAPTAGKGGKPRAGDIDYTA